MCLLNTRGIHAATANPQRIRTDTDVREIKQQRVCPANSTLNSVHGCALFNSAMDGGGSKQNRVRTANSQLKNEHGRSFFSVPAVNLYSRLVVSERTRMSGVLISSDVFAAQKLASGSVHGCTLPDRLFAKKLMVKGFSKPTRTSVVPYRIEFACKLVAHECTRMYIRGRGICGVAILCGKFLEKYANILIFLAKNLQKSYKVLWRCK